MTVSGSTLLNYLDLFNGKSVKSTTTGLFPVYGSNGKIGFSDKPLYSNAIILGRVGAYCGSVQLQRNEFWASDNTIVVKNNEKSDLQFLYYYLINLKLNQFAGGAAQPLITHTLLNSIKVNFPDVQTQGKIADTISVYDELIENNERRIKILEEMAQRLYTEWFVKFKFPGHEKVKMVDSPLGKIPEDWEVGRLKDIVKNTNNTTKSGEHLKDIKYVPIDCIDSKELLISKFEESENAKSSLLLFEKGDILFGAMRPYFHKVAIAFSPGVTRSTCLVLRPEKFLYFSALTLFRKETIDYATSHAQGSTIPYVNWENSLEKKTCAIPSAELLEKFENIVEPLLLLAENLSKQKISLAKTRDLLIPQLVTGRKELKS